VLIKFDKADGETYHANSYKNILYIFNSIKAESYKTLIINTLFFIRSFCNITP